MPDKHKMLTQASLNHAQPRSASKRHRGAAPAVRLYETSYPISGTLGETYLRARGLDNQRDFAALRFHPHYYYKGADTGEAKAWPALIAPVTNLEEETTGVFRIWLSPHGKATIPVDPAHQGFGDLIGNAVRFGSAADRMIAGLTLEATLSLRAARPDVPAVALLNPELALAVTWPERLRDLFIARDALPENAAVYDGIAARASSKGIAVHPIVPRGRDFNDDLKSFGLEALRKALASQLPSWGE